MVITAGTYVPKTDKTLFTVLGAIAALLLAVAVLLRLADPAIFLGLRVGLLMYTLFMLAVAVIGFRRLVLRPKLFMIDPHHKTVYIFGPVFIQVYECSIIKMACRGRYRGNCLFYPVYGRRRPAVYRLPLKGETLTAFMDAFEEAGGTIVCYKCRRRCPIGHNGTAGTGPDPKKSP